MACSVGLRKSQTFWWLVPRSLRASWSSTFAPQKPKDRCVMTRAVPTLADRAPVFPGVSMAEVGFCLQLSVFQKAQRSPVTRAVHWGTFMGDASVNTVLPFLMVLQSAANTSTLLSQRGKNRTSPPPESGRGDEWKRGSSNPGVLTAPQPVNIRQPRPGSQEFASHTMQARGSQKAAGRRVPGYTWGPC